MSNQDKDADKMKIKMKIKMKTALDMKIKMKIKMKIRMKMEMKGKRRMNPHNHPGIGLAFSKDLPTFSGEVLLEILRTVHRQLAREPAG